MNIISPKSGLSPRSIKTKYNRCYDSNRCNWQVPVTFLHCFLLACGMVAADMRADCCQCSAAIDEITWHVNHNQEYKQYSNDDADDNSEAWP